jgi:hypothetical protein
VVSREQQDSVASGDRAEEVAEPMQDTGRRRRLPAPASRPGDLSCSAQWVSRSHIGRTPPAVSPAYPMCPRRQLSSIVVSSE